MSWVVRPHRKEVPAPQLCWPDGGVAEQGGAGALEAWQHKGCVFRFRCDTLSTLKCTGPSHSRSCWAGGPRPFSCAVGRKSGCTSKGGQDA